MEQFVYHNATAEEAQVWLFGVPDESGSGSERDSAREGPKNLRELSNLDLQPCPTGCYEAQRGPVSTKLCDRGDISKKRVGERIADAMRQDKKVITIGGDHSITYHVMKGITQVHKDVCFIYFDTHPDFNKPNPERYFGSVLYDMLELPVDYKHSALLGIRAIESFEREQIEKSGILAYTTLDIYELGLRRIIEEVTARVGGRKVYISVDLDVFDPSVAPAVSTPYPGGLQTLDVLALVDAFSKLDCVGFDIMEYSPRWDSQDRTGRLANVITLEMLKNL